MSIDEKQPWFIKQSNGGLYPCSRAGKMDAFVAMPLALIAACLTTALILVPFGLKYLAGLGVLILPFFGKITTGTMPKDRIIPHTKPGVHATGMALLNGEA